MRVVIAPDKFKGSATALEVADALREGLVAQRPDLIVDRIPLADGGEGTVDAAIAAGFTRVTARVKGPTGEPVDAAYAVRDTEAVIEMAAASGLDLLPAGTFAPLTATSYGTGELIRDALRRGHTSITLGVGGSACTDGGAGMLQALGARLCGDAGEIGRGGGALVQLTSVDLTNLDPLVHTARFTLATDVDHPLLGARGAAAVFAPQKGADTDDVRVLEQGLTRFAEVLRSQPGAVDAATAPGAGAAGGVGFGALAVLGAHRVSGADVVQQLVHLDTRLAEADLVITGEGSLDEQSLGGKTALAVVDAASRHGLRVIAVCGRSLLTDAQVSAAGFDALYTLQSRASEPQESMERARELLADIGTEIARDTLRTTS